MYGLCVWLWYPDETKLVFGIKKVFFLVSQFRYLGINIFASLQKTITKNYNGTLNKIKADLDRWQKLPISLPGRISIIKMNALPRINFCSQMLPLSPPPRYWNDIRAMIIRFLWKGRRAKIKLDNLQRKKELGALSVPNFKLYFHTFALCPVVNWFGDKQLNAWINIERSLVAPVQLQDVLFTNLSIKKCKQKYGQIITSAIENLRKIERMLKWKSKWHTNTPLFHNDLLKSGGKLSSHRSGKEQEQTPWEIS